MAEKMNTSSGIRRFFLSRSPTFHLYSFVILINIILSALLLIGNAALNRDAVLYIISATAYATDGWSAASSVYYWPLFPVIIGQISLIGISPEAAAKTLAFFCSLSISCLFVYVTGLLNKSRAVQWTAALVVLSLPILNGIRDQVIRDAPYLVLCLLSLAFCLRFVESRAVTMWCLSCAMSILAILFRVEGIMVALACIAIGAALHAKIRLALAMLSFFVLLSVFTLWKATDLADAINNPVVQIVSLRLYELSAYATQLLSANGAIVQKIEVLESSVLSKASGNYASYAYFAVVLSLFVGKFVECLTWVYSAFLMSTPFRNSSVSRYVRHGNVLLFFACLASIPALVHSFATLHLSTRYLLFPSLLLLLIVMPLVTDSMVALWRRSGAIQRCLGLVVLVALFIAANIGKFSTESHRLRAAGEALAAAGGGWCNDILVCYYAENYELALKQYNDATAAQLTDAVVNSYSVFAYQTSRGEHIQDSVSRYRLKILHTYKGRKGTTVFLLRKV